VTASFDHLMGMVTGKISFDKLFMSGQLKVSGNLAKGAEIRWLLCKLVDLFFQIISPPQGGAAWRHPAGVLRFTLP